MNWRHLQHQWQAAGTGAGNSNGNGNGTDGVMAVIAARERALTAAVRFRDLIESVAALTLMPLFSWAAWHEGRAGNLVSALAAVFLVLWALVVILMLRRARRRLPVLRPDTDLRRYLLAERDALQAQYRLLDRILGWYVAPCALGVIVFFVGIAGMGPASLLYATLVLGLGAGIWRWNRHVARVRYAPRIAAIAREIEAIDKE